MMSIPFIVFWVFVFMGRNILGIKGVLFCIALWIGLLLGFAILGVSPYFFVAAQALIDTVLLISILGDGGGLR